MSGARPLTVLVTGAGGPLGVNLTRALRKGSVGVRVVGTDANRWHLPLSECDQTWRIPPARDRDGYARALAAIATAASIDVLVPTHPVEVRAVAALRDAGALSGMAVALPRTAIIEIADDKAATHARLAAAGVAVPATCLLRNPDDVERAFVELAAAPGEPIWVRGSGAPGLGIGAAALPCRDAAVARGWIEHHRGWGKMAASELLPGANLSWMGAYADGVLLAAGTRERLEYVLPHVAPSGVTGAPAVSRTVARPDVAAIGRAAVRALDDRPHGVYFVDLKEDRVGAPRVTEINAGRCGTTILAYEAAGFNFPWLLVRIARGEAVAPLPDPDAACRTDCYWLRTLDCGPVALEGEAGFDAFPSAGFTP